MTIRIKATIVNDDNRLSFLPKYFGKWMTHAEGCVYDKLKNICPAYHGGFWNFYELSNGGFYMAPEITEALPIFVESNGYECAMSADAAGIVTSLYALNKFCSVIEDEAMINRYYWLRDYALEHSEVKHILGAID